MPDATPALIGGCSCGKVRYKSSEAPSETAYCYCGTCRSLHGEPYAAFAVIARKGFEWTAQEGLDWIGTSPIASRVVCRFCDVPIAMLYPALPDELAVAVPSVDQPSSRVGVPEVTKHIFVAEKPDGYTIEEGGLQFDHFSEKSPVPS